MLFIAGAAATLSTTVSTTVSANDSAQAPDGRWLQTGLDAGNPQVTGWVVGFLAAQRDLDRQLDAELARLRSALNEAGMSRIDRDRQLAEARLDALLRWQARSRGPAGVGDAQAAVLLRRYLAEHPEALPTDAADVLRRALLAGAR
jgi:hypothetical protein